MSKSQTMRLEEKNFERDADFNKVLHGSAARKRGGLLAMGGKNHEAASAANAQWFSQFSRQKEADETQSDRDAREKNAVSMTKAYYDLATDFYEYGWGGSFHFSRYYKGESLTQAVARHEHYLAYQTGITKGMNVLDVGCGVGGPAREICHFTDANIIGLNNNDYQIDRARVYAEQAGLSDKLKFVKGDFMQMDFDANTFDAVYAIEATVHAPSLEGVYGEIYRVLKPGGFFGVYEWLMTDKYDESNARHREIRRGIELGDGIAKMVRVEVADAALKSVGFEILHREDLAQRNDAIPWYYPLTGDLRYARSFWDYFTVFRISHTGRFITQSMMKVLETARILPKGSVAVGNALSIAADSLVAGAKEGIFTPMMLYVCQKPATLPENGH